MVSLEVYETVEGSGVGKAALLKSISVGRWVADLESGQRERLLPDFQMQQYSVSPNGRRAVFVPASETGRRGVWLAMLDGSAAPRQKTASFTSDQAMDNMEASQAAHSIEFRLNPAREQLCHARIRQVSLVQHT
jgi:hypothetical protein